MTPSQPEVIHSGGWQLPLWAELVKQEQNLAEVVVGGTLVMLMGIMQPRGPTSPLTCQLSL